MLRDKQVKAAEQNAETTGLILTVADVFVVVESVRQTDGHLHVVRRYVFHRHWQLTQSRKHNQLYTSRWTDRKEINFLVQNIDRVGFERN